MLSSDIITLCATFNDKSLSLIEHVTIMWEYMCIEFVFKVFPSWLKEWEHLSCLRWKENALQVHNGAPENVQPLKVWRAQFGWQGPL